MNILVSVNSEYLDPLSVMLYSLLSHNKNRLNVYVLHCGISKKNQASFQKKMNGFQKSIIIHFIEIKNEELSDVQLYGRFKNEAILRLLLLRVIPRHINKILWLDADIIIQGSIQKMYGYPDHGQYALVCEDMFPKWEKYCLLSKIGMKNNERYFNSGVILFYLNNIRKDFGETMFLEWAVKNPDKLLYPDQNTLNICLKKKLIWANSEIYNLQLSRVNKKMKRDKIIINSKIVHFNTIIKPWDDEYMGEGEELFWKYGVKVLGIKACISHYIQKYKKSIKETIKVFKCGLF